MFFFCYTDKGSNRPKYSFTFSQLSLYSVKWIFFNYLVFESFLWIGEFWVGGSVDWWSVSKWSVVGWLVTGGFNNALSEYASALDLSKSFLRKKIFYNSFKNIFDMKCSKDLERVAEYPVSNPNFTQKKYIFV